MKKIKFFIFVLIFILISYLFVFFNNPDKEIIKFIRIPRFFQALFTGGALGFSGAIFQSVLKNPLADPFIMGVSSGAMLFALICKILGISYNNPLFYIIVSFGGFFVSILCYFFAREKSKTSNVNLLLSGVAINAFITSFIMLFVIFKKDNLIYFFHFTFGNFSGLNKNEIFFSSLIIIFSFIFSLFFKRKMDILSFDEEKAITLGEKTETLKFIFFALASLATSSAVAMSGIIGFIGLIAPNISRLLFFQKSSYILYYSFLIGSFLSVFSDLIGKNIISPIEIPVGIITAFLGAPFFIFILKKNKDLK